MKRLLMNDFKGRHYIGIPVTDIERSITLKRPIGFSPSLMEKACMKATEKQRYLSWIRNGEIIKPYQRPDNLREETKARRDGGKDHIDFTLADIQPAFD